VVEHVFRVVLNFELFLKLAGTSAAALSGPATHWWIIASAWRSAESGLSWIPT